ncbi:T9SS C-terminal target domain-containing protein [candidate division KSB1 bacterium]|nr:T9SS type A sorting domain-containing protein [candidate division KSB1 bacterium]RQW05192.1 MAG: T9SS C-terminal target domain-containing protein [candidate division KSB1 bacterium]
MSKLARLKLLFIFQLLFLSYGLSQGVPYYGPDDPAGDPTAVRIGVLDANNLTLHLTNTTELAYWPDGNPSLWNDGSNAIKMLNGMALLVAARVYVENDSIPVTDPWIIEMRRPALDSLFYCQTYYRVGMDMDPDNHVPWGFLPVFGYFNEECDYFAMSTRPESWPVDGWPAHRYEKKWPGVWNGRFGLDVHKADVETFFVANDAQDQEYLGPENRVRYHPRPGIKIGDISPRDVANKGKPWGGLGLRVEHRGFQWTNQQARDILFSEYTISNISDYDLPEIIFGFWMDSRISGDADDNYYFDESVDLVYSWDVDGSGFSGGNTGTMGYAFLESPGLYYDGLDNDHDGVIDERRDNTARGLIGPYDGIYDLETFLEFYGLTEDQLKNHWDADEDQDWRDGNDTNNNGIYESIEFAGDDIGLDGIGPTDINYIGPDLDGTECNHRPDVYSGIGSEPNFGLLDVDESDMLGMTAFHVSPYPNSTNTTPWFRDDAGMWALLNDQTLAEYSGHISDIVLTFASGAFPLYRGWSERISVAQLHSHEDLAGTNYPDHAVPVLFQLKKTAQKIYQNDYQFDESPQYVEEIVVHPGDTNNDGLVDKFDILPIGYYFERITQARDSTSIVWAAHTVKAKQDFLVFPAGQYADTNGDGIINIKDVLAVAVNWGNKHANAHPTSGRNLFDKKQMQNHKEAFVAIYNSLEGNSPAVREMRDMLKEIFSDIPVPSEYVLEQNYPNPFNPTTTIEFSLPRHHTVSLKIYNTLGQLVHTLAENEPYEAGVHLLYIRTDNLSSGVYFYRITAGDWSCSRKMMITK